MKKFMTILGILIVLILIGCVVPDDMIETNDKSEIEYVDYAKDSQANKIITYYNLEHKDNPIKSEMVTCSENGAGPVTTVQLESTKFEIGYGDGEFRYEFWTNDTREVAGLKAAIKQFEGDRPHVTNWETSTLEDGSLYIYNPF